MRRHEWRTPLELFKEDKPDVSYFRVFGTLAYVWIHPDQRQDKLSPKSEEMIFIGYEPNTKGYHCRTTNLTVVGQPGDVWGSEVR